MNFRDEPQCMSGRTNIVLVQTRFVGYNNRCADRIITYYVAGTNTRQDRMNLYTSITIQHFMCSQKFSMGFRSGYWLARI